VRRGRRSGPKMVLKPFPAKSPLNAAGSPSGGVVEGGAGLVWIRAKLSKEEIARGVESSRVIIDRS
jgi:hypothetical protein